MGEGNIETFRKPDEDSAKPEYFMSAAILRQRIDSCSNGQNSDLLPKFGNYHALPYPYDDNPVMKLVDPNGTLNNNRIATYPYDLPLELTGVPTPTDRCFSSSSEYKSSKHSKGADSNGTRDTVNSSPFSVDRPRGEITFEKLTKLAQLLETTCTEAGILNPSTQERKIQDNLAQSLAKHGENSWDTKKCLMNYNNFLRSQGRSLEAAQVFELYLAIEQGGKEPAKMQASTCDCIAFDLREDGRTKEASCWDARAKALRNPSAWEQEAQEKLAKSIAEHGANSWNTQFSLTGYQGTLRNNGRSLEGAELLKQRFAIEQHNKMPADAQASTCNSIAAALHEAGRTKEASCWGARAEALRNPSKWEQEAQEKLAKSIAEHGANSWDTQFNLTVYQGTLRNNGCSLEGAELLKQHFAIEQHNKKPADAQATTCESIAAALHEIERFGDALEWQLRARQLRAEYLRARH